ncbi:MAG: hypothetical protein BHK79_00815 [Halanaerobium sp. MDAL1]|nr:MAG: hypothetical protein BHK79_00815 [Halanaerobium sp. MDAL1]
MNNNKVVLSIIKQNLNHLTPATEKVALYIISTPGAVINKTAAEVAEASNTSEASVIRFCKSLGFNGFHDFKINLAQDLGADNDRPAPENINRDDTPWEIFNKIIVAEQENLDIALKIMDKEIFTKVVEVLSKTNRIGFFAVGSSYPVAYDTYWKFSRIGVLCQIEQDPGGQLMIARSLRKGDVAFAISRSGQSKIPNLALETAREKGATTISLTQNPNSKIVKKSDYALITSERSNCVHDAATSSRISHLGVLDGLYSAVTVKKWSETTKNMKENYKLIRSEQF